MALFVKIMGLSWLLAEGLIMVFVRRGVRFLETGKTNQNVFVIFCVGVFLIVAALTLNSALPASWLPDTGNNFWDIFYDRFLWNIQCTL